MSATAPGSDQLRFEVQGMSCAHCERAITSEVRELPNVSDVAVDIDGGLVTVSGQELAEQVVREAIALAGYDAHLQR